MEPQKHGDYQTCSIFLATDDISLIPHEIEFRIGGMRFTTSVCPRKWLQKPVFHQTDLPPTWFSYPPPATPRTPSTAPSSSQPQPIPSDPLWPHEDDLLPMSRKALREIFRGFSPSDLPPEFAACLAETSKHQPLAPSGVHLTEQQTILPSDVLVTDQQPLAYTGSIDRPTPHRATPQIASPDPRHFPSLEPSHLASKSPKLAQHAAPPNPGPTQILPDSQPPPTPATVHRTQARSAHNEGPLPDLALLLCHSGKDLHTPDADRAIWDPHVLFPELGSPPNKKNKAAFMMARTKAHVAAQAIPPPNPLHRTTRGRISKKANSHSGLEKLDAQAFVDVPLQYAEGLKILQSIGATDISIPPHLMAQAASDPNQAHRAPTAPTSPKGLGPQPSLLGSLPRPASPNSGPLQEPCADGNNEEVHLADP